MRNMLQGAIAMVALAFCHTAIAQEAQGTLVVDVQAFTSEKELPKKVDKQLRNGGLEWGVRMARWSSPWSPSSSSISRSTI